MNEAEAMEAGYVFHGAYSRNKEEIKTRAKELKALGNKAIVVRVPDSKYSRGPRGVGYSVYWIESEENYKARIKKETETRLKRMQAELDKINAKRDQLIDDIYELRLKLTTM